MIENANILEYGTEYGKQRMLLSLSLNKLLPVIFVNVIIFERF